MAKKKERERPYGFGLDRPRIGWYVFSEKENEIVQYGEIYLRWAKSGCHSRYHQPFKIEMSRDGQKWTAGQRWESLYRDVFKTGFQTWGPYEKYEQHTKRLQAPTLEARDKFIADRTAALKALSPEERKSIKQKRADELATKREEEIGKDARKAINCLIAVGPQFIKLKDKIDTAVALMSKGNIGKPIPYHERKLGHLYEAMNLLDDYIAHMKKCQEGSKKKKA